MRFLCDEELAVEKEALSFLDQCEDFLLAEYERENGNQLDTDRAKELFPQFSATAETRVRFASAVYRPASRLIDLLFERKLKGYSDLSGPIVFLAGGPGVGKTTFAETIRETLNEAYLVMDGTLSDFARAVWFVESALEVGSEVLINFIHRDTPKRSMG